MEKREVIKQDVIQTLKNGFIRARNSMDEIDEEDFQRHMEDSKFAIALSATAMSEIDRYLDLRYGKPKEGSGVTIKRAAHQMTLASEAATEILVSLLHVYPENVQQGILEDVSSRVTLECALMNDPDVLSACRTDRSC